MVRIRLRRTGLKGQPSFRLVVADKESPRDGRFLEIVGFYNPRTDPTTLEIKEERVYEWMNKGALPTESVGQLFKAYGLAERYERLKKGESVATLLAEAEQAKAARLASRKTRKYVVSAPDDSSSPKGTGRRRSRSQETSDSG